MTTPRNLLRRTPWWAAVFLLALACRLAFLWATDGPVAFGHERIYFSTGVAIADHPDPWGFVLRDEAWRSWAGPHWVLPPLYHLFLGAFLRLVSRSYATVQLVQCVFGALTAVGVGLVGREIDRARGAWAGAAYALHWPSVMLPSTTLTENLHTLLLVWSFALMAGAARTGAAARAGLAGLLLGLSALTRTASLAFAPVAPLVHLRWRGWRDGRRGALALALACGAAVIPWTVRNAIVHRELIFVDTVSSYNLWWANLFVNEDRARMQEASIQAQPTLGTTARRAVVLALRNIRRSPQTLLVKAWDNARYFVRPDALDALLRVEFPHPAWLQAAWVVLGDLPFLLALPLFAAFAACGRPSPARSLVLLWAGLYLFLLIVVYHVTLRYRSALTPFLFAGAAGGLTPLLDSARRRRALFALGAGAALAALTIVPYVPLAWNAARAELSLRAMEASVARGELEAADRAVRAAAERNPRAVRPWLRYGRALSHAGRGPEAIAAYEQAARANGGHATAPLVLPQLLREAGRHEEARAAQPRADAAAAAWDAWWALEVAWRELPPPRTDEVRLATGDIGAVRGFLDARAGWRWTRDRAIVRMRPTRPAAAYEVTLEMASPLPSPFAAPVVAVGAEGLPPTRFALARDVRAYTVRVPAPAGGTLAIRIEAPTWTRVGELPEQGVRVDRVSVAPVAPVRAPRESRGAAPAGARP